MGQSLGTTIALINNALLLPKDPQLEQNYSPFEKKMNKKKIISYINNFYTTFPLP